LFGRPCARPSSTVALASGEDLQSDFCVASPLSRNFLARTSIEALLERREQSRLFERFFDEIDNAGLHRSDRQRNVAMSGHDDHRQRHALLLQHLLDLQSVHARHSNVGQDAAVGEIPGGLQEVDAGFIGLDLVAGVFSMKLTERRTAGSSSTKMGAR
jgi:hypothetical protein